MLELVRYITWIINKTSDGIYKSLFIKISDWGQGYRYTDFINLHGEHHIDIIRYYNNQCYGVYCVIQADRAMQTNHARAAQTNHIQANQPAYPVIELTCYARGKKSGVSYEWEPYNFRISNISHYYHGHKYGKFYSWDIFRPVEDYETESHHLSSISSESFTKIHDVNYELHRDGSFKQICYSGDINKVYFYVNGILRRYMKHKISVLQREHYYWDKNGLLERKAKLYHGEFHGFIYEWDAGRLVKLEKWYEGMLEKRYL